MTEIGKLLEDLERDPDYVRLSYAQQVEVKSRLIPPLLMKDQDFIDANPKVKMASLDALIYQQPPSIPDKALQRQAGFMAQAAMQGDQNALKAMSRYVGASTLISSSILVNLVGSKAIAPLVAEANNVKLTPELESSQLWAASPRDRAQISEYFEALVSRDELRYQKLRAMKTWAGIGGNLIDLVPLYALTAGTSAVPMGLGRLAMSGALRAAKTATSTAAKWAIGVYGATAHAVVTAGIGVARENVRELLNQVDRDPEWQNILRKNLKWFGGYYLGDVVFNFLLDTALPMVRTGKLAFATPKNVDWLGMPESQFWEIEKAAVTGLDIDPYLFERLPLELKESIKSMQSVALFHKNFPSGTPEQLAIMLGMEKGYSVYQPLAFKGTGKLMARAKEGRLLEFEDYKALIAWTTNNWSTPGGGTRSLVKAKKGKVISFEPWVEEQGLVPATMTKETYKKWLVRKAGELDPQQLAGKYGSQGIVKQYGTSNLEELAEKRLAELGLTGKVKVVVDNGSVDGQVLDPQTGRAYLPSRPGFVLGLTSGMKGRPGIDASYLIDITGASRHFSEMAPQTLFHEIEHVMDMEMGWVTGGRYVRTGRAVKAIVERAGTPKKPWLWHHVFYENFRIDAAHRYAVKRAIELGYEVPEAVMREYPDLANYAMRQFIPSGEVAAQIGAAMDEIGFKGIIRARLPVAARGNVDVLTRLFASSLKADEWDVIKLNQFLKVYIQAVGGKKRGVAALTEMFQLRKTKEADGSVVLRLLKGERNLVGTYPIKSQGINADKEFLETLIKHVDEDLFQKAPGVRSPTAARLLKGYEQSLAEQNLFTPSFAQHVALKRFGGEIVPMGNDYKLLVYNVPGNPTSGVKNTITFSSLDEAIRDMAVANVDEAWARAYLKREGFNLIYAKQKGVFQVRAPGVEEPLYEADSVFDLFKDNPNLLPKLPDDLGPSLAVTSSGSLQATYTKGVLTGDLQAVFKEMDRFGGIEVAPKVTLYAGRRGTISIVKGAKEIEVYIPSVGYRRSFTDIKAAKEYLAGGYKTYDNITRIAAVKGYRLEPVNGRWALYTNDKAFLTDNLDQVEGVLKDAPVPEWAPELIWPKELLEPFQKPPEGTFKPLDYHGVHPKAPWKMMLSKWWRTPDQWFAEWMEAGGDPKLMPLYREIEDARMAMRAQENRMGDIIDGVFRRPAGKMPSRERRVYIGEYMKAPQEYKSKVIAARNLTQEEVKVGDDLRRVFTDLYQKFGVNEKFITDYLPRISKYFMLNRMKHYSDDAVGKFLKDCFGPMPPVELDAFFKHRRLSDIAAMALEDDPLVLMQRYSNIGHRQLYLGPSFKRAREYIDNSSDPVGSERFLSYLNDVMGLPQSQLEAALANATLDTLGKFGLKGKTARDYVSSVMSLGYVSALGFRPFTAIRNLLQPWVTLAPRLGLDGNDWLRKAVKVLIDDKAGRVYETMASKGVFLSNLPLYGGELFSQETILGKVAATGMKWYRNSDDFTRALGWLAYQMKFDDALERFQKGILNDVQFQEMSGIESMMPDVREQMKSLIRDRNWVAARDLGCTRIVDETMFPYRSATGPYAFRGVVGKVFGMFGHWPLNYIENIRRGFRYGSTAHKAAFAATWLANSFTLYAAFQGMGMNADSFLPWVPAQFSGGPYWHFSHQLVQSLGRGYKGRQARAELLGLTVRDGQLEWSPQKGELLKWLVPGGFALWSLDRVRERANEGDVWGAFLAASGAPLSPAWLERGF